MLRTLVRRETLLASATVFVLFGLISLLPWREVDALDPVREAMADFKLTDIVYSKLRNERPPDSNIVIVNIGRMSRAKIAQALERVAQAGPAVIGIDAFFRTLREPQGDSALASVLQRHGDNVILVNELSSFDPATERFGRVETSHPNFNQWVTNGYANVTSDPSSPKTIRGISPVQPVGDKIVPSFALALVERYDSAAATRCLARRNAQEVINWRGNYASFYFLDTTGVIDTAQSLALLRGKIVLMAFIDVIDRNRSVEDLYFTPLNERYTGKTFPDMYGIVIHANMISMLLSGEYVDHMPDWLGILIAVVLGHMLFAFFTWWYHHRLEWFALAVAVSHVVLIPLLLLLTVLVFNQSRYELQITYALMVVLWGPFVLMIVLPLYQRLFRPKAVIR